MGRVLGPQGHRFTGFGVAAHAWVALPEGEATKATDFNAITIGNGGAHVIDDFSDR